jgi:hypothetical protein
MLDLKSGGFVEGDNLSKRIGKKESKARVFMAMIDSKEVRSRGKMHALFSWRV